MIIKIILYVFIYLVMGLILTYGLMAAHLIIAYKKGYKVIEYWTKNNSLQIVDNLDLEEGSFWVGLAIWPYKLFIAIVVIIPRLYKSYDQK